MHPIQVLIALLTKDNDYQHEQASAARAAAAKHGMRAEVVYADNNAVTQTEQLLEAIQAPAGIRPDAIIVLPVGTPMPKIATAAVNAGIGWVVLNRDIDYIGALRQLTSVPVFSVTSNQSEIGRLQAEQIRHLLPEGGQVLYIQGPSSSFAAQLRAEAMLATRPRNVQIRVLNAQWTESSAHQAALSFLRLRTSRDRQIDMICGQNDSMALGVHKALREVCANWSSIPVTGVDGLPETGQRWVREGLLTATIRVPINADIAVTMLHEALRTKSQPREVTVTTPQSFPDLGELIQKFSGSLDFQR